MICDNGDLNCIMTSINFQFNLWKEAAPTQFARKFNFNSYDFCLIIFFSANSDALHQEKNMRLTQLKCIKWNSLGIKRKAQKQKEIALHKKEPVSKILNTPIDSALNTNVPLFI